MKTAGSPAMTNSFQLSRSLFLRLRPGASSWVLINSHKVVHQQFIAIQIVLQHWSAVPSCGVREETICREMAHSTVSWHRVQLFAHHLPHSRFASMWVCPHPQRRKCCCFYCTIKSALRQLLLWFGIVWITLTWIELFFSKFKKKNKLWWN